MVVYILVGAVLGLALALGCYYVGYRRGEADAHALRNHLRDLEKRNWKPL